MPDPSLYSLFSERGREAYSNLLDRDENSAGGGDVGARILWPSPLYATPEHRTVAAEMAAILAGPQYDYAYIAKQGGDRSWKESKRIDRKAFESWVRDYDLKADRLARLPPGSDPADPLVRQRMLDIYKGTWPGVGFAAPPAGLVEPQFESEVPSRLFSLNGRTGWPSLSRLGQDYVDGWRR